MLSSDKRYPAVIDFRHYLAFHGSSGYFRAFDADTGRYESRTLCLSASPLVAAGYGSHIYGCILSQVRLIAIEGHEWLQMSEVAFSGFEKSNADGFLIYPSKALCDTELDATFRAEMIALWRIEKCRIVSRLKVHGLNFLF